MPRLGGKGPTSTKRSGLRKDPVHKASDYSQPYDYVKNPVPGMKYCHVPPNATGNYEAQGWVLSIASETNTVRPSRGKVLPNGTMETLGCLLMEMPEEQWNDLNENGVAGRGGQAKADRMEKLMALRGVGVDPIRGIHGDTFSAFDESQAKETLIARRSA